DGIRDFHVTGVQTCALPIWLLSKENTMTIKMGDRVPEGTLAEFIETATDTCAVGPNNFQVADLVKGKKIALFAVPGAFTPTCSEIGRASCRDRVCVMLVVCR